MLETARDYWLAVEARLIGSLTVRSFHVSRVENLGNIGLYRLRADLSDNSRLTMFERFQVQAGKVHIEKYSFHWQTSAGELISRWDNAPHHSHLPTAPHHIHQGMENYVLAHDPIDAAKVLLVIEDLLRPA